MPYTSLAEIERQKALSQQLGGFKRNQYDPTGMSGLAQVLSQWSGGLAGKNAANAASGNDELRQQEMQQLSQAMTGRGHSGQVQFPTGAAPQAQPQGMGPQPAPQGGGIQDYNFQHPDSQALGMQLALGDRNSARDQENAIALQNMKNNSASNMGNTPLWFEGENPGEFTVGRFGPEGIVFPDTGGRNALPDSGRMGFDPSSIFRQGDADTQVEVDNINQTAVPAAEAARREEQAVQEARLSTQRTFEADAARQRVTATTATIDDTTDKVNALLSHSGLGTATGLSSYLDPRNIVGKGRDAKALINNLKNRVFIDTLQSMRENSKTGGAVGNVSNEEGARMENAMASLETAQSDEQFVEQLQEILGILERTKSGLETGYESMFWGSQAAPSGTPAASNEGSVLRFDAQGNPI